MEGNDLFGIRRFSLRRCTVRHLLYMFLTLVAITLTTARLAWSQDWTTLPIAATGLALMALVFGLSVRATVKRTVVDQWIQRLGMGDFEYSLKPRANSEVDKMLVALEAVRRKALDTTQLDLVRTLSEQLQTKNEELEATLTELRGTQDQLVSQQKLNELHEMTSAIAHEISNPLNLAMNFNQLSTPLLNDLLAQVDGSPALQEEEKDPLRELVQDLRDNLERTLVHCTRASTVVNQALRLGDGRSGLSLPTNINDLVRSQVHLAYQAAREEENAPETAITLNLDPTAGHPSVVPEDLATVLNHLVSNSCAGLRERKEETQDNAYQPRLAATTARAGSRVQVRIRDNGAGIPEEIIPYIFNPFFTTKPAGQGTGLGLSLCYDVVREHGGALTVKSDPGNFTEFTISLPDNGGMGQPTPVQLQTPDSHLHRRP